MKLWRLPAAGASLSNLRKAAAGVSIIVHQGKNRQHLVANSAFAGSQVLEGASGRLFARGSLQLRGSFAGVGCRWHDAGRFEKVFGGSGGSSSLFRSFMGKLRLIFLMPAPKNKDRIL